MGLAVFVAIVKIAIKFYSVQQEGRKEIFSFSSWKTPNYQEKSARGNPRMTNANRRLGSEILGAITLKNVITPATNFPEFAFSSISFSPRIIFRESRAILKIKKREEEDKERLQQSQFARVNPKWFLIPFPRNERTRLFPPSTFIFLFSPFSRSPVVLPLTSLSLSSFLQFEGWRRMSCPLTWRSFMDFQDGFPRKRVNSAR